MIKSHELDENIKVSLPPIDIIYWNNNENDSKHNINNNKIKMLDFHYTTPLIVSSDRDNNIIVWDYFMKSKVFHKSLKDIYNDTKSHNENDNNDNNNYITISNDKNIHNFSTYPVGKHLSSLANAKKNKEYVPALFSTKENNIFNRLIGKDNDINEHNSNNIDIKINGEIHKLMFANNSQSLFNRGHSFKNHYNSNTDTRIVIICDIGVIIYDFIKQTGVSITLNELIKPPTYAEFIYYDYIAIGCNDGVIRIWDISPSRFKEIKTLTAHVKGIITIKSLAISSINEQSDSVRIRFLTIASDSKLLIWETSVKDDMYELDGTAPSAELMDTGSGGSPDIITSYSFIDTTTNILYTIHGDRSLRLWKMDELDNSTGSYKNNEKKNKRNRRSSLSAFLGANNTNISSKLGISRMGKIKPLGSNSNDITKFVSCISLDDCPRYSSGTFMLCSKTDIITIAQISNEGADNDDANGKLRILHEFCVFNLLVAYLHSLDVGDSEILTIISSATQNHPIKVYTLAKHHHYNHLYALGTSIGPIVITLLPNNIPSVASSSLWLNNILTIDDNHINVKKISIQSSESKYGIALTKILTKGINIPQSVTTCKPNYHVSPNSDYVTVNWPDSLFYIIYKINARNNDINDVNEVERGYCLSFAWITNHHSNNYGDDKEIYCILKPNYKLVVEKRRSLFSKSELEVDSITDTDLVFKYITSSSSLSCKSCAIPNDFHQKFKMTNIRELFGGSSLLCMSYTNKKKRDSKANSNDKKSSDVIADIVEDYNYYSRVAMKSKFFHIMISYNDDDNVELVATPIGPTMSAVTSITWDNNNDNNNSRKGAVVIDSRINIVQYDTNINSDGNVSITFKTITSIAIEASPYATIMSFYWYKGCLFTSSSSSINALYTSASSSSSLRVAESFPIRYNFTIPIDSTIFVNDNDDDDDDIPIPPSYCNFEIFNFDKGLLLLVSRNNSNNIISIPLSSSPIAYAGLLKNNNDEI